MKPSRLFSAGWQAMMEGAGHWTLPAWAVLGPGQLAPRWLWVGSVDCAERQEPPGKKLLSEKKLVRPVTGEELGAASLSGGTGVVLHSRYRVFIYPHYVIGGTHVGLETMR